MKNWYIVQTFSGFEHKVAETLKDTVKKKEELFKDQIEEVLVPTHEVTEVTDGCRYAYLTNYGQGSPAHDRNVFVHDERESGKQGKSWLPVLEPLRSR